MKNLSMWLEGDRSIAIRALLLASLSHQECILQNYPRSLDGQALPLILKQLGAQIEINQSELRICQRRYISPISPLDAQNSGTTARLLLSLLSQLPFPIKLTGDESLQKRPFRRIIEPLSRMGARIFSKNEQLPLEIFPARLRGIQYTLSIASAQIKSALMFAGWLAEENPTVLAGKIHSRDHLEKLAAWLELPFQQQGDRIEVAPTNAFPQFHLTLPLDISSAAFLIAAALICSCELILHNVLLNPTRLGFVHVLQKAGVVFEMEIIQERPEPVGNLILKPFSKSIDGIFIQPDEVPFCIDEIPLLAVLAVLLHVPFRAEGIEELRYKECDRLSVLVKNLQQADQKVEVTQTSLRFEPQSVRSSLGVDCAHDHRMMMSFALFALQGYTVKGLDKRLCQISFPLFWEALKQF